MEQSSDFESDHKALCIADRFCARTSLGAGDVISLAGVAFYLLLVWNKVILF